MPHGWPTQQGSAAAPPPLYDHHGAKSVYSPRSVPDAGDAVMARWLQSAGLQHLASPSASTGSGADNRPSPNTLMQGYATEERQRLLQLMRSLNFSGGESGTLESFTPPTQCSGGAAAATDGFFSPDQLRGGDFGAGLLDLHSMDDSELLSEHMGMPEPFEQSPFVPGNDTNGDFLVVQQMGDNKNSSVLIPSDNNDGTSTREIPVAKIKVVVRKRPINKKEASRREEDIVTVADNVYLTVHEPKLKVDLTAYVEKHEFCFDAVLDEHVTNDEVYRVTVEPIIPTVFQRTKATCFAYGQTGSGKTFTMQPLPLRAAQDMIQLLRHPVHLNQKSKLWLSYFEIYGGKLFDLLHDRKKLCMREDGRQKVCIVGLQEFEVLDVQSVREFIERGNAARSTGSTGANEESSRSHAILQLAVKRHDGEAREAKRSSSSSSSSSSSAADGKFVGKISFIDLAGSERGADTTDNDRQTRIEGADINKSLLALKECIRALDNDQIHIPFRGSKLTEVLRDSFVGNSRTVMISCVSPNAGSCEHTLNTLRYADRVKSLSRTASGSKKDPSPSVPPPASLASDEAAAPRRPDGDDVARDFDGRMNAVLEEEDALIAAHRREIEDTMEIIREEMNLLAEVEQPGSTVDNYVMQLSYILSRKAASLATLQARLTRFQQRLKEQAILSRKWVPR